MIITLINNINENSINKEVQTCAALEFLQKSTVQGTQIILGVNYQYYLDKKADVKCG